MVTGLLHVDIHTISDSITNPPVRSVSIETALSRLSILHRYMHIRKQYISKNISGADAPYRRDFRAPGSNSVSSISPPPPYPVQVLVSIVNSSPSSTILWNTLCYVLKVHNEAEIREEWSDKNQSRLLNRNYEQCHWQWWSYGYYVWMRATCRGKVIPLQARCGPEGK